MSGRRASGGEDAAHRTDGQAFERAVAGMGSLTDWITTPAVAQAFAAKADALNCDPRMLVPLVFSVIHFLLGAQAFVSPNWNDKGSWVVPLVMWNVVVAYSGTGKSAPFKRVRKVQEEMLRLHGGEALVVLFFQQGGATRAFAAVQPPAWFDVAFNQLELGDYAFALAHAEAPHAFRLRVGGKLSEKVELLEIAALSESGPRKVTWLYWQLHERRNGVLVFTPVMVGGMQKRMQHSYIDPTGSKPSEMLMVWAHSPAERAAQLIDDKYTLDVEQLHDLQDCLLQMESAPGVHPSDSEDEPVQRSKKRKAAARRGSSGRARARARGRAAATADSDSDGDDAAPQHETGAGAAGGNGAADGTAAGERSSRPRRRGTAAPRG